MRSTGDRVADDVESLRAALVDLTPGTAAAAAVALPVAVDRAPRRSGLLASSLRTVVTATGYAIESPLPYAAPVHAAQPWLVDVMMSTETQQVDALDRYLTEHTP